MKIMFRGSLIQNSFFRRATRVVMPTFAPLNRYTHPTYTFSPRGYKMPNWAALLACGTLFLSLSYQLYKSNTKEAQIDDAILPNKDSGQWHIVHEKDFKRAGHGSTVGRSHGYKLKRKDSVTGETEYFYCKEPFDRKTFQNELIIGALGYMLYPDEFPRVYALQSDLDLPGKAKYSFLSESKAHGEIYHSNLEDYAIELYEDEEAIRTAPHNLGLPLAFDLAVGKTDSKLANFVTVHSREYPCYPIDNESAGRAAPIFLESSHGAIHYILEYSEKKFDGHLMKVMVEDLDTKFANPHQPLLAKPEILAHAEPILKEAIEEDFKTKRVQQFYLKFSSISDAEIKKLTTLYGPLFTSADQESYFDELQKRRDACKKFVTEHPKLFADVPASEVRYGR